MSITVLVWGASIAVLAVHRFVLANRSSVWLGAMVPAAWVVAAGFLVAQGRVVDLRGWLAVVGGLVILLSLGADGQAARKKRLKREDERIDALNARGGAAAPSTS